MKKISHGRRKFVGVSNKDIIEADVFHLVWRKHEFLFKIHHTYDSLVLVASRRQRWLWSAEVIA